MGIKKKPRILVWDIETSWGLHANTGGLYCLAYKTLEQRGTRVISLWDYPGWEVDVFDDGKLVKDAHKVLSEADGFITHYGSKFDLPYFNSRCIAHNIPPLPTIPHIDTWRIARYKLKLHSNRLNALADFLKVGSKMYIGQQAWKDIMNRNKKACRRMARYCKQDVDVLERVYLRLRALDSWGPNHNLFKVEKPVCHNCGADAIEWRGSSITKTRRYKRYQCKACGSWGKVNSKDKDPRNL